ncbi:hypothetical protein K1T71_004984 [Dendrolimus kikuchii]|uniref:Uncharacterized protein n=1 Tax=Dendrolimus kikuchii TaxID=765133 RepID=A0ACC1D794_9NEOP|nr:hypothetical protein K1T71_004984 [Dendrolimus kikuchii]
MWSLVLCIIMMMIPFGSVSGQPIACSRDEQCHEDNFCDKSAKICRECIMCEDLKREPPLNLSPPACIKSVSDCGGCIKGLVVNLLGDVYSECVPAASQADSYMLPTYVWVLISIALLFVVIIIIGVVLYVLRNKETIKMISWMERLHSDPPPPYNPYYTAVRPESPAPHAPSEPKSQFPPNTNTNEDAVFVKRNPLPDHQLVFEKDGNQAATVYNPPNYSVGEQPPTTEQPTETEVSDTLENPMLHDEDTVESVWSPYVGEDSTANNNATNMNVAVPVVGRPNKKLCLSQDANNNRNRDASSSTSDGSNAGGAFSCSPSPTQAKPPNFVINVVQINNSK